MEDQSTGDRRTRNRRAFPRWPADFEVRYQAGGIMIQGTPLEIGENGLAMNVEQAPPLGVEINLEFRLLDSMEDWVTVKVMVKHLEGQRCGVEFLNLRRADRLKIVDYVYKGRQA